LKSAESHARFPFTGFRIFRSSRVSTANDATGMSPAAYSNLPRTKLSTNMDESTAVK
jgi:hypothetical protein